MKKFYLLSVLAVGIFSSSCTSWTSYIANYSVSLAAVESPVDAKQRFGETKVVTFDENGINKYRYEDDYIDIVWYVGQTEFHFTLKNKSNHTLKINWDDVSYVDVNGQASRVMHSGVKYIDRNNSQPATAVPKNASISDILLPTENVYFYAGNWQKRYLVPSVYETSKAFNEKASSVVGKTMTIMMPIMIEDVQNDYTFTFNIDKLLNESKNAIHIN